MNNRLRKSILLILMSLIIVIAGCNPVDPLGLVGVQPPPEEPDIQEYEYIQPDEPDKTEESTPSKETTEPEADEEKEEETKTPPPPPVTGVEGIDSFVDFSGVWYYPYSGTRTGICKALRWTSTRRCDFNAAGYLDWMELRTVSSTIEDGVVIVEYEGEYHHAHSFYEKMDEEGRWNTLAYIEEHEFAVSGSAEYHIEKGYIDFHVSGELTDTPWYDHFSSVGISGEGSEFGVYTSTDIEYSGKVYRQAELPEDGKYRFLFGYGETAEGSRGEAPEGMHSSVDYQKWDTLTGMIYPIFYRTFVNSTEPLRVTGDITGTVVSKSGGFNIERGTVQLFDEEDEDVVLRQTSITDGTFVFEDVPVFVESEGSTSGALRHPYYIVKVISAEADVDREVFGQPVVFFGSDEKYNVQAGDELVFKLDGVPEIGTKRGLAQILMEIGENNYSEYEYPVLEWLDDISETELDDAVLEQLRRGIWAERVVREAAESADSALGMTLDSLGNLFAELYGDFVNIESKRMSDSKRYQEKRDLYKQGDLQDASTLLGVDPNNRLEYSQALERLSSRADASDVAGFMGTSIKLMTFALSDGLEAAGMDPGEAAKYAGWWAYGARSLLDYVKTDSLIGSAKISIKTVIPKIVKALQPVIFDNRLEVEIPVLGGFEFDEIVESFPSYTKATEEYLETAVDKMMNWEEEDWEAYQEDSINTANILNELIEDATDLAVRHKWITAVMNTADLSTDAFDLLGKTGVKAFKIAELICKFVKYVTNAAAIIDPAVFFFYTAPTVTEEGVYSAFGEIPPPSVPDDGSETTPAPGTTPDTSGRLVGEYSSSVSENAAELKQNIDELADLLSEDRIGDAIEKTVGTGDGTYDIAVTDWNDSLDIVLDQAFSMDSSSYGLTIAGYLSQAFTQRVELFEIEDDFASRMIEFYNKVMLAEYEGPSDPYYMIERNKIIAVGTALQAKIDELLESLDELVPLLSQLSLPPSVRVDISSIESAETGGATISKSSEEMKITANIRNVSDVQLSGLTALLAVVSPRGTTEIIGSSEIQVNGGSLGADEKAEVEWSVRYTGDLEEESVLLAAYVLENGQSPSSFVVSEDERLLLVDPLVTDTDLDGMPDTYESENGLDINTDDTGEDADGDGLDNLLEYEIGTDADNPDTDGDGLSDGEEIEGGDDGYITDPLAADSDEDGVNDARDGSPTDPENTGEGERPGEPQVEVGKTVITLTPDKPMDTVIISNGGEGNLYWCALTQNDALAVTFPSYPEIHEGDVLIVSVPEGFVFEYEGMIETTIRVIDAYGVDKDVKEITVRVGRDS